MERDLLLKVMEIAFAPTEAKCPLCNKKLTKVEQSKESKLNKDQWKAARAGDWYCDCSNNDRGRAPMAYFWNHEVN